MTNTQSISSDKYYYLEVGDIIQEGDEFKASISGTWTPITRGGFHNHLIGESRRKTHVMMRRLKRDVHPVNVF